MSFRSILFVMITFLSATAHAFCFSEASQKYGVDEKLLMAIAKVESNFKPSAIHTNTNGSTDVGLMQINSQHFKTLKRFNITEKSIMEPCLNVHVGAWILANMIKEFGPTWRAVGAYNAGGRPDREALRAVYAAKVSNALDLVSKPPLQNYQRSDAVPSSMQVME